MRSNVGEDRPSSFMNEDGRAPLCHGLYVRGHVEKRVLFKTG